MGVGYHKVRRKDGERMDSCGQDDVVVEGGWLGIGWVGQGWVYCEEKGHTLASSPRPCEETLAR